MTGNRFAELHDFCQTLTPKVKRNLVINKVKELARVEKVRTIAATLDTSVTRGYFLHASNTDNEFVKQNGFHVIVLARGLNPCWERFVNVKEAMHLLDDQEEAIDSREKFDQLLNYWESPATATNPTPQTLSDIKAMWMALACLCPEKSRLEFEVLLNKGQIDNYGIALKLRVPELYVPMLFKPEYKQAIEALRS